MSAFSATRPERHPGARPRRRVLRQQPVDDVLEVALPTAGRGARSAPATSRCARRCSRGRPRAAARRGPGSSGSPFIAHASSTSCRRALSSGIEPPKRCAGLASGHRSAPSKPDVRGAGQRPGQRQDVGERDAVQVAVPVAPGPHGASPGMSRIAIRPARRLPAHCSVAVTSRSRNASRSVASESDSSRSTSPWTRRRNAPSLDLRDRPVPADVERVGRGDRSLRQRREPGLDVERLLLVDDQVC